MKKEQQEKIEKIYNDYIDKVNIEFKKFSNTVLSSFNNIKNDKNIGTVSAFNNRITDQNEYFRANLTNLLESFYFDLKNLEEYYTNLTHHTILNRKPYIGYVAMNYNLDIDESFKKFVKNNFLDYEYLDNNIIKTNKYKIKLITNENDLKGILFDSFEFDKSCKQDSELFKMLSKHIIRKNS